MKIDDRNKYNEQVIETQLEINIVVYHYSPLPPYTGTLGHFPLHPAASPGASDAHNHFPHIATLRTTSAPTLHHTRLHSTNPAAVTPCQVQHQSYSVNIISFHTKVGVPVCINYNSIFLSETRCLEGDQCCMLCACCLYCNVTVTEIVQFCTKCFYFQMRL